MAQMMIKNSLLGATLSVFLYTFSACYYDNTEELYTNAELSCDTVSVQFNQDVSGIIAKSCATTDCHSTNSGLLPLTNYNEIKASINNGRFIQRLFIQKDMPPSGPLDNCNTNKILSWINNGTLND